MCTLYSQHVEKKKPEIEIARIVMDVESERRVIRCLVYIGTYVERVLILRDEYCTIYSDPSRKSNPIEI